MASTKANKEFFKNFSSILVRDKAIAGHTSTSSEIIMLEINATGTKVVCSRTDKSIRIWKLYPDRVVEPIVIEDAHTKAVEMISWNPKTEHSFASVGRDEYVKVWRGSSGSLEKAVKIEGSGNSNASKAIVSLKYIKYLPDGELLIVIDRDSRLYLLSVEDGYKVVHEMTLPEHVYDLIWFNQDHSYFVCALHDGTMPVYKIRQDQGEYDILLLSTLTGHRSSVTALSIDPLGKFLVGGSNEGVVSFWDLSTMINYKVLTEVDESIACIDTSRDGAYVACSYDGGSNIKIFDLESMELVFEIPQSLSGEMTFGHIRWFPHKTAFAYTSDYGTTFTVMKKAEPFKRKKIER